MTTTLEIMGGLSQLLLGFVFMNAGGLKVGLEKSDLVEDWGAWVADLPAFGLRMLGAVEVMAGFAVVMPMIFDLPRRMIFAGSVIMLMVMAGSLFTHARRGDRPRFLLSLVLTALAGLVLLNSARG